MTGLGTFPYDRPMHPTAGPMSSRGAEARPSTDELRQAVHAAGLGTWSWDRSTGTVIWGGRMAELYDLGAGRFDGTLDGWMGRIVADDREPARTAIDPRSADEETFRTEHRVVLADGSVRWIECIGAVLRDADGTVVGSSGCARDVSEQMLTVGMLDRYADEVAALLDGERARRERLEHLAAISQALEDADGLPSMIERVVGALVPRLAEIATYHLFDQDTVDVVMAERWTATVSEETVTIDRRPLVEGDIDPWWFDELVGDRRPAAVRDGGTDRAAVAVAVARGGWLTGVLEVAGAPGGGAYDADDLALLVEIAKHVGEQVENRRLVEIRDRTAEVDAALAELGRGLIEAAEEDDVIDLVLGTADILHASDLSVAMVIDSTTVERRCRDGSATRSEVTEPVLPGVVLEEVVQSGLRMFTTTEEQASRSVLLSPLLDDERCTVAVLIFEWDHVRRFDATDRNAIETLTRLCGQALRRAQLGRASVQLAEIARSFAIARTAVELADQLIAHAETFLGSTAVALRFFDQGEANLVSVADSLPREGLSDRFDSLSMDVVAPPTDAVRSDRSVWVEDLQPHRERYASVVEVVDEAAVRSAASIPLHDSDGSVVGVVSFGWPKPMRFGRRRRSHLETLADLAAQALERVRLHESEHAVVRALQRQLLTEPVDHGDIEIATRYEPAAAAVGMGGDWYQDFELDDGSVAAIVGDVVGHGVNAIAAMSRLQHLLVALVRVGTPLKELLATLDAIIAPGDALATAILLHVDPAQDRLGFLAAGHPPPLLVRPGQAPEVLEGARRPLLGVRAGRLTGTSGPDQLRYVDFPPGATVLAYTDGLIERRQETIDAGIDRLSRAVAAEDLATADLTAGLGRIVERLRATDASRLGTVDDVAVLAVRRHAAD
jgi:serine phosphatase RsbU (regulator of sigma subunit)